ncbi:OsmC family protein [Microlunatus ginsengisoli]|uniref:OsmC family protein n=1 Tax=Microlunatus ginsengisoli TaxID=363863 RepID=A0ABP7AJ32_9ACTN
MSVTTRPTRNGVDTATLFATIDAVRQQPEAARFRFRTQTEWVSGTHSRGRFPGFFGAGQEHVHASPGAGDAVIDADHPAVLVGTDTGPTPAELLLNALGACLTAGLGNIAAARGVDLHGVSCRVEGDIDLRGILGIDPEVRNGFSAITVTFDVSADADPATIAALVDQSRARSAVFDVLTNGTQVDVRVAAR